MPSVYVKVALNRPLRDAFAYKVDAPDPSALPGARVRVSFAGSQTVGVIVSTCTADETGLPPSKIKKAELLDPNGLIPEDVRRMVEFGSRYYHHPIGQCYATAIPKLLRDGAKCAYAEIPALRAADHQDPAAIARIRSSEQLQILEILKGGPVRRRELRERGFSSQSENALVKRGLAVKTDLSGDITPWRELGGKLLREEPPKPGAEQQAAIDAIESCNGFGAFLLDGVTGSGKTEVYLRAIENVLSKGRAALVLVPEISLTPQTFNRFYRRFSVPVTSMHSQLSDRERLDAFIDMASGRAAIIIGTRTALFTPIPNLGLIVLDEEHDTSFKQTDGFRYHARSLALVRGQQCRCPVVMGSATPSLESYYNAGRGLYTKLDLHTRAGGASMPDCEIVDLRQEPLTDGLPAGIGQTLEDRIGEETARGNQVLLFLNRRGFSHHMFCHACGHVFTCPSCDNPLTVHRAQGRLKCHVCESSFPIPRKCPECGAEALMETGFGTEQTEAFLRLRYPDVGIERIDRDTVATKAALEDKLDRIRSGESQILLGTQMVAKGHDFPDVTLVGMLDVDSGLYSDDFRAREYSAQLLTQVAGRAGRAAKHGVVLVQTHSPDSLLLNELVDPSVSYDRIAAELLEEREAMQLPPATSQAFLLSNSTDRNRAYELLQRVRDELERAAAKWPGVKVSPVLSDKMEKRQNRYHFHILLTSDSRSGLSALLDAAAAAADKAAPGGDVRFAVEVDPIIMY
jgi:primosomal protein N' (replication factor Y)